MKAVPMCLRAYVPMLLFFLLATSDEQRATVSAEEPPPEAPAQAPEPWIEALDTNEDGTTDEWRTHEFQGSDRLTQVKRDRDGDGRVEVWIYFEEGAPVRSEVDRNGDGQADLVRWMAKGMADRERGDLNFDDKSDAWIFYKNGQKDLMIMDKNHDGTPDAWFYYDPTGWKLRGGRMDEDYDGKVDRTFGQVPEQEEERKPW